MISTRMNAFWNANNPYQQQGEFPTVLCICSAGLLRSPTIAYVLSNEGYNTRAAGVYDYALVEVDDVLIQWADIIVFAEKEHKNYLYTKYDLSKKKVYCLDLPDKYPYRDPELIELIKQRWKEQQDDKNIA